MADELVAQSQAAQRVWENFGNETRRAELSHWRGVGKWANDKKWIGVGKRSLISLNRLLRDLKLSRDYWSTPRCVLEWGPGGGTNAVAFGPYSSVYYGVDISSKNLNEAKRVTEAEGYSIFNPILLSNDPREVIRSIKQPVDIFLSTAVFQHFPSPEYGAEVLKVIHDVCRPNAVGFIQIRYAPADDRYLTVRRLNEYEKRFVTATTYAIEHFWRLCEEAGFKVVFVSDLNESVSYVTFYLQRKP